MNSDYACFLADAKYRREFMEGLDALIEILKNGYRFQEMALYCASRERLEAEIKRFRLS